LLWDTGIKTGRNAAGFEKRAGEQIRERKTNRRVPSVYHRLIVLRHNFCRLYVAALLPQQGHRGRVLMSALINRMRMVAIEFAMWRSGRKGGSSGSITFG
jgi:hypothetical protein